MDAIDRFGQELVQAGRRRHTGPRPLRALLGARLARTSPRRRAPAHLRVALIALVLVLATAAITLAATGVILTGSPVRTARAPIATADEGIPVAGGARLLPLRAPDPAGGLPWGMRIIHTTRGLVCVQIGRVYHGQLGQLGVDGAFHDDGRFHPLPADALPGDLANAAGWMSGNCSSPGDTYAGDSVGLQLNAATSPGAGAGVPADRREISFGLLGVHAVDITYREGSKTLTRPVLPGLGAYLIVQRYTSGRLLGSVSETDGRDEPGNYSGPAGPNGALTATTYDYAGRSCVDRGNLRMASCGLSEVPPPSPAALPVVHEPLHAHLQIRNHVITSAQISFHAPYAVTNAEESYSVSAPVCHGGLAGNGSRADLARGALVTIPVGRALSEACSRAVKFTVEYARFADGLPRPTPLGSITIHEPRGAHPAPLPRQIVEQERRSHPTRSLHATIHLTLVPQPRAACNAAFLLYPCYRGEVGFTAPYAVASPAPGYPRAAVYSIEGFATCKAGGRPGESWGIYRHVRAHEAITTTSLGLFVVTPACASREGFEVTYLNQRGPSAGAPHESVIVGTATLSKATLPDGKSPKPPAR
ncbi:MAG TPA: hypothetical protein VK790_09425 [Solirubrobacteraceae bacterium]|jgi:hypothetical protein|nr:hypothetical protein [Solirubrobacteraceae bacterium]